MEQTSWKRLLVAKAFLLYLTSSVFKVRVAGTLEDVCATCHVNATCHDKMDGSGGKVCTCMYGFLGNGITQCQDKNECQAGRGKICGDHTVCHNTYGSFYCTCLRGYSPSNNLVIFIPNDGTQCKDIDECKVLFVSDIDECKVQGICGEGGWCTNVQGDFSCRCQAGYKVQNGSQPFHPHRDTAFCKAIDCGQPPSVTYATQLSGTGTRYGSVAKFGCLEGFFQKSGNNTAICGEKGVWEGLSLVCEEIDCGDPPTLPHSVMTWNKASKLGTKVSYRCSAGFYSVGDGNISVCNTRGQWDKASMQCEEIKCGDPPVLPHSGQVWNGSTNLGSAVSYYCNKGFYQEQGGNVSYCVGNGYWTKPTLVCKETQCGRPPHIQSLVTQWDGSVSVGSVSYYSCQEGFHKVTGSDASVCTVNGQWQGVTLTCKEIECGEPPSFPHSITFWNNSTKIGTEVSYQCQAGFYHAGSGNASVCAADGHWDHANILCQEINCGPPAVFPNTDLLWDRTAVLGSVVHYACKHGFYLEGGRNHSTCTSAREWERITVTCREINCGPPAVFPNTDLLWDRTAVLGSVVHYACKHGFYLEGGRNHSTCTSAREWERTTVTCRGGDGPSVCTANGHWDVASLQCQEVDCGVPMLIPHASVLWNKPSRMGSVAYYICDRGYYSVNGKTRSVCGANGLWEDITMLCEEINCGPPAVFPNTDLLWDRTAVLGSVVHYACKHGFYLEGGRNHSTCTSAREWERITVTCRARCGPPPSLPRWEVAWQNGSSAGSVALHRCQRGYRRWRGRSLSICEDTGMWQPATLVCREIRPAISKLVLFNEKCLRWTAERYDERGEDYTVQIVGSRDYQRAFRDVRKRVFSSESDQPELCLNLQPGTNYTINITALSARFSCTITANTSIHAPPVPEVVFRDVEVPLPSLWLRRSMNTLDPISMYQVFVVPLEGRVAFDCRSASEARFHSDTPAALYLAAQIPVADVGAELSFTVGDQRHYGEYYNAPLQPGRDYYIILRAVSQWGRVRKQSCVFWAKVRGTSYIIQSATMLTGGLIGLVAFVVFLRFAHVWYCKKT
ncbi:sushi domain-containing protein 1 isoform X4 [Anguilla anguilla]|uniref:sushi domain-containing protein 1 isoform X4 n=1 Tax=Anguilla anguilla TaxID=7936 RepID=UPI0015A90E52|nr:sushi domain-containing protein 1 isoform X4 [Anguilla anguilla]